MEKEDYKAGISPGSFSSNGLIHRALGIKTGRMHVMLSKHEFNYFLLLDFTDNVKDIQEQLLLDLEETQLIAKAIGVRHPYDYKKKQLHCISSDFLVQLEDRTIARTVKPMQNLNKRVIEKFEIERIYWENRDVEWGIVTEQQLPKILIENLLKFREYSQLSFPEQLTTQFLHEVVLLWDENITIRQLVIKISSNLKIAYGKGYRIILHLLARKKLHFDHTYKFSEQILLKQAICHVNKNHL